MGLSAAALGWIGLALVLFFTTFGVLGGAVLLLYAVSFLVGFLVMLYWYGKSKTQDWFKSNRHLVFPPPSAGFPQLVEGVRAGRPQLKTDKRMTGSCSIDEVLSEVLNYTYRDHIHSWYKRISDDEEKFRYDIRQTMQRVIIAFSERSKHVELVPYFSTRLVDDFASHIRLYRRALERVREHQKDDTKPPADLESIFFDLETEMENNMCRDMICTNPQSERQYLADLSEVLLFLLLPPEDFHNKPFRYIIREVLVNGILLPSVNQLSDPDYINQTISWLHKDSHLTSEAFIVILKTSDNMDELQAVKEKTDVDIARQRSKDTGGEDVPEAPVRQHHSTVLIRPTRRPTVKRSTSLSSKSPSLNTVIKQQLGSLMFVKQTCEQRIKRLQDGLDETDFQLPAGWDLKSLAGQKLYPLPFDVVLNNNVALSYFIEFMTNIGAQGYLFFYLTIEGYRVSAEQQISAALLAEGSNEKPDLDMLRDAALSIYNQYLSEKALPKLKLDEVLVRNLWESIQEDEPSDTIFDEIQARVWDLLQEDKYFPSFKKSQLYIRLLAELDLLKDPSRSDTESLAGDEGPVHLPNGKSSSLSRLSVPNVGSGSSKSSSLQASMEDLASSCDSLSSAETGVNLIHNNSRTSNYTLSAQITNTGICREHGKAYAVYLITVTKSNSNGSEEVWDVYRRYSDFHDLHSTIQERYDSLSGLALPSKKTFNNMNKEFLEKRRVGLNAYLQALLNPSLLNNHKGLLELIFNFLEHMVWEREKSQLARKMDTFVNPLKKSVQNVGQIVKAMPDNFVDGVAKVSGNFRNIPTNMLDGVGKMLNVKGGKVTSGRLRRLPPTGMAPNIKADLLDSAKVGKLLETEDDQDNIPMRIMLLLLDEVFELKSRNQWLRRRIVAILRQIIKATMGDSINRKIVDHVEFLTSADQVAEYIKKFRDSYWPNGVPAEPLPPRDYSTKMRTRVVAKTKMLGSMTDELRHMLGSETTRQGVVRVFNLFQHPVLNKRLIYVILEGMLETLFPDNKFPEVFRKIHSRSPRVKTSAPVPEVKVPPRKRRSIRRDRKS